MVGIDGFFMLEMRYRFFDNRIMIVFKLIKIYLLILGIIMCFRFYFNSDFDFVVGLI